ncbi:hypothetical protein [Aestuariirhabdus litorea]|uniref:Uncharacterized protein n=1 Tax=Aestuariirhabdus litorea TaxID=2528527 RepID=A0A3P3VQS4_9GAMM|nr:hypothetical protein [Aestuariirhabdus litorea]RRJ83173.1 hypothetical protein D0544_15170 [Aestuariirhabdus litorea]RWW93330.1 hypothetical protein DZC74_15140 [Endozoicomonadaceae bacterium GTF-13]
MPILMLMLRMAVLPHWMWHEEPDEKHFYHRTFTPRYRAKRRIVRTLWLAAGLLMLCNPVLPFVILIGLPMTLLGFVILDETR